MNKPHTTYQLNKDTYEVIGLPIGQGSYGVVWKARRASDQTWVALKTVQTSQKDGTIYDSGFFKTIVAAQKREVAFLKSIGPEQAEKHHILPLLDDGESETKLGSGQLVPIPVMVFPLCECNLNAYVGSGDQQRFSFDGDTFLEWVKQMAGALAFLHSLKTPDGIFVHRDLKFQNVLVKENHLYLCDFGTVRARKTDLTQTHAGTPFWAGPEMLIPRIIENGGPRYDFNQKADIYALGLLLHALITGNSTMAQRRAGGLITALGEPIPGAEKHFNRIGGLTDRELEVLKQEARLLFEDPDRTLIPMDLPDANIVVGEMLSLLQGMLYARAAKRPGAKAVINHIERISDLLHPRLTALVLTAPDELHLDRDCPIRITARGRGLPDTGAWLHLELNGRPLAGVNAAKINESDWETLVPGFEETGEYAFKAYSVVDSQRIESNIHSVLVSASPEQLWQKGHYAEVLIRDPDGTAWLAELDQRAKKNARFRKEYLNILERAMEVHPRHKELNLRYWPLRDQVEKEGGKEKKIRPKQPGPKPPLPWKKIGFFSAILIVLSLAVYFIPFADIWETITGTTVDPETELQKQRKKQAEDAYQEILDAFNSGDWKRASQKITAHQTIFESYLQTDKRQNLANSSAICQDMIRAEEAVKKQPATMDTLETAIASYTSAQNAAVSYPKALPIIQNRLQTTLEKQDRLRENMALAEKKDEAENTYNKIIVLTNAGPWTDAEKKLLAAQNDLDRYLDPKRKEHLETLAGFFNDAAKGARAAEKRPETLQSLDDALANYQKAMQKANALPDHIKLSARMRDRIDDVESRRKNLIFATKRKQADGTYADIVKLMNNGQWGRAANSLKSAQDDLKRYLDDEKKAHLGLMADFLENFSSAEEIEAKQPKNMEALNRAMAYYTKALKIGERLPSDIRVSQSVRNKINAIEKRIEALKPEPSKSKRNILKKDGHFIAYDDGTVLDTKNNLMWAAKDNGKNINWHDAKKHCESHKAGGYSDWRMPTLAELETLYDKNKTSKNPPTGGCGGGYHLATELIHITCCCPWASENEGSRAALFYFNYGDRYWDHPSNDYDVRALPVRVGN